MALAADDTATGQFIGDVFHEPAGSPPICGPGTGDQVTFDATANTYGISFPASCIGSPSSLAVTAETDYSSLFYMSPEEGACCAVAPDVESTTTTSSTSTTTTPAGISTTAPASSTTTTTAAVVTANTSPTNASSTPSPATTSSSRQLAFTGPGSGLRSTAVVGAGLLVLGLLLLVVADVPRQLVRRLTWTRLQLTTAAGSRRSRTRRNEPQAGTTRSQLLRRAAWLLGR